MRSSLSAWQRELRLSLWECELHAPAIQMEHDDNVIWVEKNICFGAVSQFLFVRVITGLLQKSPSVNVVFLRVSLRVLMRSNIHNQEENAADRGERASRARTRTHTQHYLVNTAQCWHLSKIVFP